MYIHVPVQSCSVTSTVYCTWFLCSTCVHIHSYFIHHVLVCNICAHLLLYRYPVRVHTFTQEHSPISMAIMPPKLELRTPCGHRVGERLPKIQYPIKNLILIFLIFDFGGCFLPSLLLSFFSIVCTLVCVLLDSNARVGTPCCNIAPCGSPCIFERCAHWVVVCCTTNNKWRGEVLLLWVEQLLVYLQVHPVI